MTETLETERERVGSFQSLDGAARAVNHLVELQHDPRHVAISPREYELVPRVRRRDRIRRAMGRGGLVAASMGGGIAVVGRLGVGQLVSDVVVPVIISAAVGCAIAAVAALVGHRRYVLSHLGSLEELRPTAFDVVVDRRSDTARHDLARWWDPAAPPVERQRVA